MTVNEFQGIYRPFSNFWYANVVNNVDYDGIVYPSVEHGYQAAKTLILEERQRIRDIRKFRDVKAAGDLLVLRPEWDRIKRRYMLTFLRQKFRYPDLKRLLLSTGNGELIEGNYWHDNYWGVCNCILCLGLKPAYNWLGKLLMHVRLEIQVKEGIE